MFSLAACLLVLALQVAGASSPGRIEVCTATQGHVLWHGHLLEPPFRFSVAYTTDPDTVWGEIFIGDLPMNPHRPPLIGPPVPSTAEQLRRSQLSQEIGAAVRADRGLGRSDVEIQEHLRSVLLNAADLVDSAKVQGEQSVYAYWKGDPRPFVFMFGVKGDKRIGPPAQVETCFLMKDSLDQGSLIILGSGQIMVPGDGSRFLTECDSLRAGKPMERSFIKDAHAVRDCAHPVPIERLVREGE